MLYFDFQRGRDIARPRALRSLRASANKKPPTPRFLLLQKKKTTTSESVPRSEQPYHRQTSPTTKHLLPPRLTEVQLFPKRIRLRVLFDTCLPSSARWSIAGRISASLQVALVWYVALRQIAEAFQIAIVVGMVARRHWACRHRADLVAAIAVRIEGNLRWRRRRDRAVGR